MRETPPFDLCREDLCLYWSRHLFRMIRIGFTEVVIACLRTGIAIMSSSSAIRCCGSAKSVTGTWISTSISCFFVKGVAARVISTP